ncbi:MAG: acetate--CoA ligase family protein [Pseudomonadota bacterium]
MTRTERLKRMLNPRRVVWVGGRSMGAAIEYMRANRFRGEALVVNPRQDQIAGLTCVSAPAELPWAPDLAVLVVPKDAVCETAAALSEHGCGAAICISSGFSESEGGTERQAELIASAGAMPVIGPNCPGVANFLDGAAFMMDHFGEHAPTRGAAVISNGGAYLSDLGCADRSQPIAYSIGLGNQAMVSIADMLDVVLDDPRVTVVNIYFEGISDVVRLSAAAAKAAARRIPVVAVKGGRSQAGARAAQSHTASLSGDAEIASALFRRFGWIEAATPSEAIETIKMLSFTAIPAGNRTGFVTSSGSYAVLGGDVAERVGLEMPPPTERAAGALETALPDYVGPSNPLDISDAHGWPLEDQRPIYEAFFRDPYDLAVEVMCYPPEGGWDMSTWDATTTAFADARGEASAAFVNTLPEALPRAARERIIALGVAPLQGLEDGLRAVASAARYGAVRDALAPESMHLPAPPRQPTGIRQITEAEAKERLRAIGVEAPALWVVDAAGAPPKVSHPCAIKAIAPSLLHKSEVNAVTLDVPPSRLAPEIRAMRERLAAQGLTAEGFLVEEMIPGAVAELLIGLRRIPDLGVALTLAIGGVAVELMDDTATVMSPASREEIETSLRSLRLFPLLDGYRGRPPAAISAALDTIETLSTFVLGRPEIVELEINPLILTVERAIVADAVLAEALEDAP